jgi:hypothetical protein
MFLAVSHPWLLDSHLPATTPPSPSDGQKAIPGNPNLKAHMSLQPHCLLARRGQKWPGDPDALPLDALAGASGYSDTITFGLRRTNSGC